MMTPISTSPEASSNAPAPRRWRRRTLLALVLLLGLVAALPYLAGPLLRGVVERELSSRGQGEARLSTLSLSWSGAQLTGLTIEDASGRPVAAVDQVGVAVDTWGVLAGRYVADVVVEGVVLHLRAGEDGRLSLEQVLEDLAGSSSTDEDEDDDDKTTPSVSGSVRVSGVDVHVHDNADDSVLATLHDLTVTLDLEALDAAAPLDVSAELSRAQQPAGALGLKGSVVAQGPGGPSADLVLTLDDLDLSLGEALAQAWRSGPAPAGLSRAGLPRAGVLAGTCALGLDPAGGLSVNASFALTGLRLPDLDQGMPDVSLTLRAEADAQLSGTHLVLLDAGELLSVRWDGSTEDMHEGAGALAGTLAVDTQLGPLLALLSAPLGLRPGLSFRGALGLDGEVQGGWSSAGVLSDALASLQLDVADFAATDADGRAIDVGGLSDSSASLALRLEGAEHLLVDRFDLSAGPVELRGAADVSGGPLGAGGRPLDVGGRVTADADLARLTELVAQLADLGGLASSGRLHLEASGSPEQVDVIVALDGVELAGLDVEGRSVPVSGLDLDATLSVPLTELDADGLPKHLELTAMTMSMPGVDVDASGTLSLTDAPGGVLNGGMNLQPGLLSEQWAAWLDGLQLRGPAIDGTFELRQDADVLVVGMHMSSPELTVLLPAAEAGGLPRPVLLQQLQLEAKTSRVASAIEMPTTLGLRTRAGSVSLDGTLRLPDDGTEPGWDFATELGTDLAAITPLLAEFGTLPPGLELGGELAWTGRASGNLARLELDGSCTLQSLDVTLPAGERVALERVELDVDVGLLPEVLDLDLASVALRSAPMSGSLRGRLTGLAALTGATALSGASEGAPAVTGARIESLDADFTYVPDLLGALLAPWLPGRLSGAEAQPFTAQVSGPLDSLEPVAALAGLTAVVDLGIGRWEDAGLVVSGPVHADVQGGRALVTGDVGVNGGRVALNGDLDLAEMFDPSREGAGSTFEIALADVSVDGALGRALQGAHPALDGLGLADGLLATLGGNVRVTYGAPLAALVDDGPLLDALTAGGTLDLGQVELSGSSFLSDLAAFRGSSSSRGASRTVTLSPLDFLLEGGRVRYASPWPWSIDGTTTQFSGSVGLDGSLDLRWGIPVDDALISEHGALASLRGDVIEIPVLGNLSAPRLAFEQVLPGLLKRAAERELQNRLREGLGLDDLVRAGIGREQKPAAPAPDGSDAQPGTGTGTGDNGEAPPGAGVNDPAELLALADEFWDQDRRDEARPLYKRIREDFKLSFVYLLNKDRIKDRAKKPKPKKKKDKKKGGKKGGG